MLSIVVEPQSFVAARSHESAGGDEIRLERSVSCVFDGNIDRGYCVPLRAINVRDFFVQALVEKQNEEI